MHRDQSAPIHARGRYDHLPAHDQSLTCPILHCISRHKTEGTAAEMTWPSQHPATYVMRLVGATPCTWCRPAALEAIRDSLQRIGLGAAFVCPRARLPISPECNNEDSQAKNAPCRV